MTEKLPRNVVGNSGLYYVCYKLSLLGWNVLPTARNTRGVDVVIFDQAGKRKFTVQVKTLSKRAAVPLGETLGPLIGDFVVVCVGLGPPPEGPSCYVLATEEVRAGVARDKGGTQSYWLAPRIYETGAFKDAWDKIGSGL